MREQTITLIRPSAAAQHSDSILDEVKQAGFAILAQCQIQLSEEQFGKLYEKHADQDYYPALKVCSGVFLEYLQLTRRRLESTRVFVRTGPCRDHLQ